MNRVQILREVVVKLTPMLAGKGLTVTQIGTRAYAKCDAKGRPVQINIPFIADDASEDFCLAIQGFIDHEVAHVLFTDWTVPAMAVDRGKEKAKEFHHDPEVAAKRMHSLANIVEDTFIEREMCKRFKGTGYNLDRLYDVFLGKSTVPALATTADPLKRFQILLVPLIRAWSGQERFKRFLDEGKYWDEELIKELCEAAPQSLIDRIPAIKNSWDSLEVAEQLYNILYPKQDDRPEGDGDGDEEDGGDGSGKSGSSSKPSKKKGDSKAKPSKDKGKEAKPDDSTKSEPEKESGGSGKDDDGSEGEEGKKGDGDKDGADGEEETDETGSPDDDDGASDDDGGDDADDDSEEESDEGEDDADSSDSEGSPVAAEADSSAEKEPARKTKFSEMSPDIEDSDVSSAVSKIIGDEAIKMTRDAPYSTVTRDWDTIAPPPDCDVRDGVARLEEATMHMVGPMQKHIERMMAARSQSIRVPGFRSGRLHGGSLHRLHVGDDRVFRRLQEHKSKETAVSLVVDNSGSMGGTRIEIAMRAAYALSQTLERVRIKHEVIGFTCYNPNYEQRAIINEETKRLGREYVRVEPLYMPVYKDWNERINPAVKRRFVMGYNGVIRLSGNVDGESVRYAGHRLLKQREVRKVMIVLSDGEPAGWNEHYRELASDLHRAVGELEKQQVEVIGIGIQTNSVKTFYKKNAVLNNLNALPGAVMGELQRILTS